MSRSEAPLTASLPDDFVARVPRLPLPDQERTLADVRSLERAAAHGSLLDVVGSIPPEDLKHMAATMTDTSSTAAAVQTQILRRLSPPARLELAVDMCATARALLRARLQEAHPAWTPREVDRELLRSTLPAAELPPSWR